MNQKISNYLKFKFNLESNIFKSLGMYSPIWGSGGADTKQKRHSKTTTPPRRRSPTPSLLGVVLSLFLGLFAHGTVADTQPH
jgi:hypothetical protein